MCGGTNTRYRDQVITYNEQVPYTIKVKVPKTIPKVPDYDYCYGIAL
jgi:hypothetical protein